MPPSYSRRRAPVTLEEAGMSVVVSLCVVGGLFGRFVVGAPWLPRSLPLIDAACNALDALVSSLVRAAAARTDMTSTAPSDAAAVISGHAAASAGEPRAIARMPPTPTASTTPSTSSSAPADAAASSGE